MSSENAIQMQGVFKTFTKKRKGWRTPLQYEKALQNISLHVKTGETYGLLGANGSGKSTLIRILSTLLLPDAGEISILGRSLPKEEAWIRQQIGRVSVDAAFYKRVSPRENLLASGQLYGLKMKEAEERSLNILDEIGFSLRRFKDPLEEMSRGMQQKVAIARALMVNPPLLLLDEPTTGLDPKSRRDLQVFLEKLRAREGTTILLTTHDMGEAERLCARIGFLAHGKLVAEGSAAELIALSQMRNLEEAFIKLAGESIEDDENENFGAD